MEGIVTMTAFLLCAVPFAIMACFGKDSMTPVSFWAGDTSLSSKVKNVPAYNAEMAKLLTGLAGLFSVKVSLILFAAECTAGFYSVYKTYKKILDTYSSGD